MPNAVSKKRKPRQIKQVIPVMMLYEFNTTNSKNIMPDKTKPIVHANFFCGAPTYSGTCLLTIMRPRIRVGDKDGVIKTRMIKSMKKAEITYLTNKKSCFKRISISEI